MGDPGQIIPLKFNIRDPNSVERAVEKSSIVVNLLGKHFSTRNFTMEQANVESARTIAKVGVRSVVYSVAFVGREEGRRGAVHPRLNQRS